MLQVPPTGDQTHVRRRYRNGGRKYGCLPRSSGLLLTSGSFPPWLGVKRPSDWLKLISSSDTTPYILLGCSTVRRSRRSFPQG